MKISVITICYNAEKEIKRTVLSVLGQTYHDFEYIVVDGKSKDCTIDIVNQYATRINHVVSEPDTGIYDAMNKGARLARGEYCIFMNAGDTFAGPEALKQAARYLDDGIDVVVGREISIKDGKVVGYVYPPKHITAMHFYRSSLSHQSTFIHRNILLQHPYDQTLRLVSDWKFWIEILVIRRLSYLPIDVEISCFDMCGSTYTQVELGKKERTLVLAECLPTEVLQTCQKEDSHFSLSWFLYRIYRRIRLGLNLIRLRNYKPDWYN